MALTEEQMRQIAERIARQVLPAAALVGVAPQGGGVHVSAEDEDEVFEVEAAKRRARLQDSAGRKVNISADHRALLEDTLANKKEVGVGGEKVLTPSGRQDAQTSSGTVVSDRSDETTKKLEDNLANKKEVGVGGEKVLTPKARQDAQTASGKVVSDLSDETTKKLEQNLVNKKDVGAGGERVLTPKGRQDAQTSTKDIKDVTGGGEAKKNRDTVEKTIKEKASLSKKGKDLGQGATGGLRQKVGTKGVMEGLEEYFQAVNGGVIDPQAEMKVIRLAVALGKSDECTEFLKVARENTNDVKRLMANKPDDFKNLLQQGEFKAMTALVKQEIASPPSKLRQGGTGAHQFVEHGAHNPIIELILRSVETSNPKSGWVSAAVEQKAVEWAEKKIADEVALLAAGNSAGPDSIGWRGNVAGPNQILAENPNYAAKNRWTGPGGLKPMSWADFVANSNTFTRPCYFQWKQNNGNVGDTLNLGPVFMEDRNDLRALTASAANAGINVPSLASRKVKVTKTVLAAEPPRPYRYPFLTDPQTELAQGKSYYHKEGNQWMTITLDVFNEAAASTQFKAVFRKTTDNYLTYKVYTAYPV